MIYSKFQDKKLSKLGMGLMRLPVLENNDALIDEPAAREMIDYAIKNGINYFDTACGYHSGNSEIVAGKILRDYPRESYYLATKFPGFDSESMTKIEEVFEKQLEKTGAEYFDFYLFHNVFDLNIDGYLDERFGVLNYLLKQKKEGRIRHLGFSTHARFPVFKRFLDAYGEHMEFCQIQLNYLDWSLQDAKSKVELLNELNIPIWAMEPLRGGRLAALPEKQLELIKKVAPEDSAASIGLRYLQSIPGVSIVLTGASTLEQLSENIEIFSAERPLSDGERSALQEIASGMLNGVLPCTACRYCVPYCPQGLDIPDLLVLYNEHLFSGGGLEGSIVHSSIPAEKQPVSCIGCRACEGVCPQQIEISEAMADFAEKLEASK